VHAAGIDHLRIVVFLWVAVCQHCFLADIPLTKAVAGVRVGYIPSAGFIINPSAAQMAQSQLDLLMAGTAEAVLMIEGFCDWLTEEEMLEVRLLFLLLYR
jgi:polyribonucleotide nucleotidyltransferase